MLAQDIIRISMDALHLLILSRLKRDRVIDPQSIKLYAYVRNNPFNLLIRMAKI
jgi:hypothetical protein